MRMRVCYLDCHEAELCCCLVIHIENLLHRLQLLYFHLLPIYRLSLVPTTLFGHFMSRFIQTTVSNSYSLDLISSGRSLIDSGYEQRKTLT
jgi:hypothetical protein